MKLYNATKPLYLERDASGVGPEIRALQVRDGMIYKIKHWTMRYLEL